MDELTNDADSITEEQLSEAYSYAAILELAMELKDEIDDFSKILHRYRPLIRIREPDWLNSHETIKLLNISKSTLKRYRRQHIIRYKTVNGLCKYRYPDILAMLCEKRNQQHCVDIS